MNSSSKKKKKLLSYSISEKGNTERSPESSKAQGKSETNNKKIWTSDALLKQMEPTVQEMEYRKQKLQSGYSIEKYSKYLKCTKCQLNLKPINEKLDKISVHSFLKVLFCKECVEFYEDGEFSVDSDGEEKYCRWCGEGGLIYSCSECISGFCTGCIKKHFGLKYNAQVKKNNNWKCFLCFPKPLWYLRFVCSFVQEEKNSKLNSSLPSPEAGIALNGGKSSKPKDCNTTQLTSAANANTLRKNENEESNKSKLSDSSVLLSEPKDSSEVVGTSALKRGIKRKHVLYSSSDESDDLVFKQKIKKAKSNGSPKSNSNKRSSDQRFVSSEILDRLEKILRLAEYQMGFGVSWSSKMLTKLFKPNSLNTSEEIINECQKIKWFFSILSTYLVESCSSVDLIEKSVETQEHKIIASPEKNQIGDYSSVVKFLDFVTNQVKVFLEKGIRLNDLLEGEVYYDNQVIGVKVKSNAPGSASSSNPARTSSPKSKSKQHEYKITDLKISNGEKTSDDESSMQNMEVEGDMDSSETDVSKRLNLSDPNIDHIDDMEDQKSKIQEILSILENA